MQKSTTSFSFLKYWKSLLWAVIIAIGLFTPGDKLTESKLFQIEQLDKILHFLIFGFLQFLILLDMHMGNVTITGRRIYFSVLVSIFYGIVTEIIQYLFISERKGSIFDFFADITGIILSVGFFFLIRKFIDRLRPLKN